MLLYLFLEFPSSSQETCFNMQGPGWWEGKAMKIKHLCFQCKVICRHLSTCLIGDLIEASVLSRTEDLDRNAGKTGKELMPLPRSLPLRKTPFESTWPGLVCVANSSSPFWTHHKCHFLLGDFGDLQHEKGGSSLSGGSITPSSGAPCT